MDYIYSRDYLEDQADKINRKYYPDRLTSIIPFNAEEFLEKLGLDIEWKYISPCDQIQGMIFFDDGEWFVWPNGKYNRGDMPKLEKFKKGTIVINQILLDYKKSRKKLRFVCTHEIVHWIKDQKFFKDNGSDCYHICNDDAFSGTKWWVNMSIKDIIERQTNYMNAAILMPREVIRREFFKRLRMKTIPNDPILYKDYMKRVIASIANEYDLNYSPVLYRLYDLNILKRDDEKKCW